jgi:hypothetical protein
MIYLITVAAIISVFWHIYKKQESSVESDEEPTGIRIKQTHPYGNDYIKLEVVSKCNYIRFDIAGIGYRKGVGKCLGEFEGRLVPEPSNPHDSHAVKIIHPNGTHVGYVPRNYDGDRVRYDLQLPCKCHCIILKGEKGYYGICTVPNK